MEPDEKKKRGRPERGALVSERMERDGRRLSEAVVAHGRVQDPRCGQCAIKMLSDPGHRCMILERPGYGYGKAGNGRPVCQVCMRENLVCVPGESADEAKRKERSRTFERTGRKRPDAGSGTNKPTKKMQMEGESEQDDESDGMSLSQTERSLSRQRPLPQNFASSSFGSHYQLPPGQFPLPEYTMSSSFKSQYPELPGKLPLPGYTASNDFAQPWGQHPPPPHYTASNDSAQPSGQLPLPQYTMSSEFSPQFGPSSDEFPFPQYIASQYERPEPQQQPETWADDFAIIYRLASTEEIMDSEFEIDSWVLSSDYVTHDELLAQSAGHLARPLVPYEGIAEGGHDMAPASAGADDFEFQFASPSGQNLFPQHIASQYELPQPQAQPETWADDFGFIYRLASTEEILNSEFGIDGWVLPNNYVTHDELVAANAGHLVRSLVLFEGRAAAAQNMTPAPSSHGDFASGSYSSQAYQHSQQASLMGQQPEGSIKSPYAEAYRDSYQSSQQASLQGPPPSLDPSPYADNHTSLHQFSQQASPQGEAQGSNFSLFAQNYQNIYLSSQHATQGLQASLAPHTTDSPYADNNHHSYRSSQDSTQGLQASLAPHPTDSPYGDNNNLSYQSSQQASLQGQAQGSILSPYAQNYHNFYLSSQQAPQGPQASLAPRITESPYARYDRHTAHNLQPNQEVFFDYDGYSYILAPPLDPSNPDCAQPTSWLLPSGRITHGLGDLQIYKEEARPLLRRDA